MLETTREIKAARESKVYKKAYREKRQVEEEEKYVVEKMNYQRQ